MNVYNLVMNTEHIKLIWSYTLAEMDVSNKSIEVAIQYVMDKTKTYLLLCMKLITNPKMCTRSCTSDRKTIYQKPKYI
uniref:Uncharacterized protein n=1 Tax=viral metagenome TaxID=1070528 RepID=A0A6C0J8A5_9ZZZZ